MNLPKPEPSAYLSDRTHCCKNANALIPYYFQVSGSEFNFLPFFFFFFSFIFLLPLPFW